MTNSEKKVLRSAIERASLKVPSNFPSCLADDLAMALRNQGLRIDWIVRSDFTGVSAMALLCCICRAGVKLSISPLEHLSVEKFTQSFASSLDSSHRASTEDAQKKSPNVNYASSQKLMKDIPNISKYTTKKKRELQRECFERDMIHYGTNKTRLVCRLLLHDLGRLSADAEDTAVNYFQLPKIDLQDLCRQFELSTGGTRNTLLGRLMLQFRLWSPPAPIFFYSRATKAHDTITEKSVRKASQINENQTKHKRIKLTHNSKVVQVAGKQPVPVPRCLATQQIRVKVIGNVGSQWFSCPNGHVLAPYCHDQDLSLLCSSCSSRQKKQQVWYSCRACDLDLCTKCVTPKKKPKPNLFGLRSYVLNPCLWIGTYQVMYANVI